MKVFSSELLLFRGLDKRSEKLDDLHSRLPMMCVRRLRALVGQAIPRNGRVLMLGTLIRLLLFVSDEEGLVGRVLVVRYRGPSLLVSFGGALILVG